MRFTSLTAVMFLVLVLVSGSNAQTAHVEASEKGVPADYQLVIAKIIETAR